MYSGLYLPRAFLYISDVQRTWPRMHGIAFRIISTTTDIAFGTGLTFSFCVVYAPSRFIKRPSAGWKSRQIDRFDGLALLRKRVSLRSLVGGLRLHAGNSQGTGHSIMMPPRARHSGVFCNVCMFPGLCDKIIDRQSILRSPACGFTMSFGKISSSRR